MNRLQLPHWHAPEQVRDILLNLPDKKRNRALYELIWLFDFDYPQDAREYENQLATLRLLWHDPRFQSLENIKYWLEEVLNGNQQAWLILQPEIIPLLEVLHTETRSAYGDHGGMTQSAAILEPFITQLFAYNTPAAHDVIWGCLYWHKTLRQIRPDWDNWLKNMIQSRQTS